MQTPPLSAYVHIPWCIHKCPYCDFNSHELKEKNINSNEELYTNALIKQIENYHDVNERSLHTIFFGGGTPSLFSPNSFKQIINTLESKFGLEKNCEITIEANPGTYDRDNFLGYKDIGINRISLGVQSFNHDHLKKLERIHNPEEALNAAKLAVETFKKVNIDLMFALPNQSLKDVMHDISKTLEIGASHISYYHLTIEPNTFFHKFPPKLPNEEESAEIFDLIIYELRKAGFHRYETSAYAKKDAQCSHNLNYWNFGDYIGFGAGAHSKLSDKENIHRYACYKSPRDYINNANNKNFYAENKTLTSKDIVFEFMMNALRLTDGFDLNLFKERTNLSINFINKEINTAKYKKLIIEKNGRIEPTILGQNFLNELLQIFLKE